MRNFRVHPNAVQSARKPVLSEAKGRVLRASNARPGIESSLVRESFLAPSARPRRVTAFSLMELMIGIVILGLGLVMVATMFPVAWTRARTRRLGPSG